MSDNTIVTDSGLRMIVHEKGNGKKPEKGQICSVQYTGKLESGKVFDSTSSRGGMPFKFPVGNGRVIKGWDEAFLDMSVGEKRTLVIPPELGYGERGAGSAIPPNSYLIFDVELEEIHE
tara:strand:- start:212 stop:568 length:357 start_codon:yes stop_codon:yes gene_type:complete